LIKAVLFDYGGTLVSPKRPWDKVILDATLSLHELMTDYGLRMGPQSFVGLNNSIFRRYALIEEKENRDVADVIKYRELVDALFPDGQEAWRSRVADEANERFWRMAMANWMVRQNARASLERLEVLGLKMAIVSNHQNPDLPRQLEEFGLARYFSSVVTSMREGTRKPDKRIFEKSLSLLHMHPEEAIFVGDSLKHDIAGAKSVGMRSILIADGTSIDLTGEVRPDYIVRDLDEIPPILASLSLS
jgi:putative hydrolase of the HAD superfamily